MIKIWIWIWIYYRFIWNLMKNCSFLLKQIFFLANFARSARTTDRKLSIIIPCIFSFLFIGREPTTWPANNCLQTMVCSCVIPSKCVLLQIIFCSCVIVIPLLCEKRQIASLSCPESDLNMKTNLVIEW